MISSLFSGMDVSPFKGSAITDNKCALFPENSQFLTKHVKGGEAKPDRLFFRFFDKKNRNRYPPTMPENKIVKISPADKKFPRLLKEIPDCPKMLYCRGNLDLLNTSCFAVAGTRKLTAYGKEAATKITGALARHFTIVSGLALGIDAIAHRATLDAGGKTIAVLGSGVDDKRIYPSTNFRLAMEITESGGLIISEYEPGTHATEFTFPQRNRIISGLSLGTLVVEADRESGSLITAGLALEQNRDVFAVPGSIFSPKSIGPNDLIKKGAKLAASAADILEEYGKNQELFKNEKMVLSTENPLERKIIDILNKKGELSADELVRQTEEETPAVLAALSTMELRGWIENIRNDFYKLKT